MNKWFRSKKSKKSKKSRRSLKKVEVKPQPPVSQEAPPTNESFIEDMVRMTNRRSNAVNGHSTFAAIQTQFSRLQRFLRFTENVRRGEEVRGGQLQVYDPLLWASTSPNLLQRFVEIELVLTDNLGDSTVLNQVNDLKKAMSWAIKHHRRVCGGIPYIYLWYIFPNSTPHLVFVASIQIHYLMKRRSMYARNIERRCVITVSLP